jgi:hypothetical protein
VAELVAQEQRVGLGQRADHAEGGQVAGAEQQRGLAVVERGQALLQAAVDRHGARGQAGAARADAPAHRRVRRGLAHPRVVGEPQVVGRAQQQDGLAVQHDARPLGATHQAHAAIEAELLELVQSLLQIHRDLSLVVSPATAGRIAGGAVAACPRNVGGGPD